MKKDRCEWTRIFQEEVHSEELCSLAFGNNGVPGIGPDAAVMIIQRGEEKGKKSENLVFEVAKGMEGVSNVKKASEFEDRELLFDLKLRYEGNDWRIQVKSCQFKKDERIAAIMKEWGMTNETEAVKKMAKRGLMIINAGMGATDEEMKLNIEKQINWWFDIKRGYSIR